MTDENRPDTTEDPTATEPEAADIDASSEEGEGAEEEQKLKLTQTVEMRDIGPCKKHIKVSIDRGAGSRRERRARPIFNLHLAICNCLLFTDQAVQSLRCRDDGILSILRYLVTVRRATG